MSALYTQAKGPIVKENPISNKNIKLIINTAIGVDNLSSFLVIYETIPATKIIKAKNAFPHYMIIFLPYFLENTPEAKAEIIKTKPETTVISLAKVFLPKVSSKIVVE